MTHAASYILDNPSNEGQKLRRIGMATGWQIWKRTVALPIIFPLDNELRYIAEPASSNAVGAIYTRLYEPEYILFLRQHMAPGGSVIDVGAHSGLFTLLLAHLTKGGVCFEPAADNFELLSDNFRLNALESFQLVQSAVADRIGETGFAVTQVFGGGNHIDETSSLRVPVTRIDAHIEQHPLPAKLSLLKIDVEGGEFEVLRSARNVLLASPDALAVVENSDAAAIEAFFAEIGWRVFAIDEHGRVLTRRDAKLRAYNLLACGPSHGLWSELGR